MTHGSLFSGIGGFDLASEWMGWDNLFYCEWNDFGARVLQHYWPNAKHYHDITKTDFTLWRGKIDILTGGFPCQPYSSAGKRLGKEDDRHLWPEMLRAIREISPTWVVGENVLGLTNWNGGMVFEEVCTDLETEGYEVQPFILPAASVNAPHRRDRVWFIAHSHGSNDGRTTRENEGESRKEQVQKRHAVRKSIKPSEVFRDASDTCNKRLERSAGQGVQRGSERLTNTCYERITSDTNGRRQSGKEYRKAESRRITKTSVSGYWQNFPTQPPLCSGDDGLPTELDGVTFPKWRNESIKAYGNAIVPQVAFQIFKAIEEYYK